MPFISWEYRLWSCARRQRKKMDWLRLARSFSGVVKSCLTDRCYAESCLVDRYYARQIVQSLCVWADEHRAVAPLGAVVAPTDVRTGKDDADISSEDGPVVR
ncbi:Arginyl-tRNA synthetase [Hordeum vulgare]|nr:Arginyl-tRNA synthetase [Hordeum vulgare]